MQYAVFTSKVKVTIFTLRKEDFGWPNASVVV